MISSSAAMMQRTLLLAFTMPATASRALTTARIGGLHRQFSTSSTPFSKASKARISANRSKPSKPSSLTSGLYVEQSVEQAPTTGSDAADASTEKTGEDVAQEAKRIQEEVEAGPEVAKPGMTEEWYDTAPKTAENVTVEKVVEQRVGEAASVMDKSSADGPAPIATPSERKAAHDAYLAQFAAEEEEIYRTKPPFPPALWLTATFVMAVFCLTGADLARVGFTTYDEETDSYVVAPAWKRYAFATGFAGVGIAAVTYGSLVPARIITRMTIRRPLNTASKYPPDALVTIHTPITKLPGLSARTVPLDSIRLLGPLSMSPKPWHPKVFASQPKKEGNGIFSKISNTILPSMKPKAATNPWKGKPRSHAPVTVKGDRASYSLARAGKESWAEDWEGLEKSLLGWKA